MDGTIFDTSESNYWAYPDAAKKFGYDIEHDRFMKVFVGRNISKISAKCEPYSADNGSS